jgi:hypothetical protein
MVGTLSSSPSLRGIALPEVAASDSRACPLRPQKGRPAEFQEKALGFAPSWESLCVLMMLRSGQHGLNS